MAGVLTHAPAGAGHRRRRSRWCCWRRLARGAAGWPTARRLLAQAGLAGIGLFVVALLAGELAGAPGARGAGRARQPGARAPAGAAQPPGDRGDGRRRAGGRPARPRARGQPGGARAARRRAAWPTGAVPAARRRRPGRRCRRAVERAFADGAWPEAGARCALTFDAGRARTLRVRVRFTRRRAPDADGCDAEELCVLFLEDLRNVQARMRQEKLAAMGRVSAGIAHEIRNPLAAIAQANALLPRTLPTPSSSSSARMVADNVERLKRIVDDVMEVAPGAPHRDRHASTPARGVGGRAPNGRAPMQLGAGRRQPVARRAAGGAAGRGFDAEHLRRVLVNLLDNALRYASAAPGAIRRAAGRARRAGRAAGVASDGAPIAAGGRAPPVRAVLLDAQPRHRTGPVYLPRAVRAPRRQHRLPAAAPARRAARATSSS